MSNRDKIYKRIGTEGNIYNPETTLVLRSQKDKVVIGRVVDGKVVPFDALTAELCEKHKFIPDKTLLEQLQAEDNDDQDQDADDQDQDADGEGDGDGDDDQDGDSGEQDQEADDDQPDQEPEPEPPVVTPPAKKPVPVPAVTTTTNQVKKPAEKAPVTPSPSTPATKQSVSKSSVKGTNTGHSGSETFKKNIAELSSEFSSVQTSLDSYKVNQEKLVSSLLAEIDRLTKENAKSEEEKFKLHQENTNLQEKIDAIKRDFMAKFN